MTSLDHIWISAIPEYREQLRRANEARAATYYAAWRAIARALGNAFEGLAAAVARARRKRRTYLALQALSDRQLRDIGLVRGEIENISAAAAAAPHGVYPRVSDLRQDGPYGAGGQAQETPGLAASDRRRGKRGSWVARPSPPATQRARAAG
jgi:uncharacterized protein YjiS (DUF1127 family)